MALPLENHHHHQQTSAAMGAEILLGIAYDTGTGRLTVHVVKGSQFYNRSSGSVTKAPDTYVKLCLRSFDGDVIAKSKTSVRPAHPHPVFTERFYFQLPAEHLPDVTLIVSVYSKKGLGPLGVGHEMIGWVAMGARSSGEDAGQHWQDMLHGADAVECATWHQLLAPDSLKSLMS